jgi:trimethylamine--corrinoid protein Co-methyltransferase
VNACNAVDTQAGYESMMSLWPTIQSHCNFVKHAAGWLEGGLCASFEKVIVDVELLQMMSAFMDELSFSADDMAFDAIADVGPGGHFFGTQHTLERYETAFYPPILSDWSNFGQWQENGSLDTAQRANKIWKQALSEYQKPPMEESIVEELEAFVAKRKENPGISIH